MTTRTDVDAWLPEEDGSEVIQAVQQNSAIERVARRVPMSTLTRKEPRAEDVDVELIPKGAPYGEDQSDVDTVLLTVYKFGKAVRIAEEDLDDTLVNVIASKQQGWASSYAKKLDNACLGVTGAPNGTTRPFLSVYRAVTEGEGGGGASASGNIVQTGAGSVGAVVPPTYDQMSQTLSKAEASDYFDPGNLVAVAHPVFRSFLRETKDDEGRPIFVQGLAGTPDTLFGYPLEYSLGARTHATATRAPTGNPLLIFGARDLLILGVRSGPESIFIDGRSGLAALTDESILKMRARRAFRPGHPDAFSVLEVRNASAS